MDFKITPCVVCGKDSKNGHYGDLPCCEECYRNETLLAYLKKNGDKVDYKGKFIKELQDGH